MKSREPETKAGRELALMDPYYLDAILAIEAEAALLARRAPDTENRLREALAQIEDWCTDSLEAIDAKHGTIQRLLLAVIPTTAANALAADSRPEQPAPLAETLRALTIAVGDYLWEVSARDDRGTCRVCGATEGLMHDSEKVCGKLAVAHRLAATGAAEPWWKRLFR